MYSNCIYRAILATALLGASPALFAQSDADAERGPLLGRFSFGGRVAILGTNLLNNQEIVRSTSDPAVTTTTTTNSAAHRVGGGVTLEFALTDKLSIGADALYHRSGYNRSVQRVEGVDDEDTTADERTTTQQFENTRADYWDVPILLRLHTKSWRKPGARGVFLAGTRIRHVSGIHTVSEFVRSDGLSDTYETPAKPSRTNSAGLVVGAGFQLVDELHFKFTPEVRVTRWFRRTFDNYPTQSARNEVELVLGFQF